MTAAAEFIRPRETAWPLPLLTEFIPPAPRAHWWSRQGHQGRRGGPRTVTTSMRFPLPLRFEFCEPPPKLHWWSRAGHPTVALLSAFTYVDAVFGVLTVPAGFLSDGASIPRFLWAVVGCPHDTYLRAAVIHDHLYRSAALPREWCDAVFLRALADCGIRLGKRRLMYRAVRLFGGLSYGRGAHA